MAGVIWHSVSLTGFGPYADRVTYTFPEGIGVLVAPNESGKSTLVAGLMATLYGLPASSSPDDFGQGRYRHQGRAPAFEGEVEFTAADGLRYRVWRDFESHRVTVTRFGPDGPERIYQGTHNPGARRGNETYEKLIAGLVGLPSRELLAATFCVTQPLPEMDQVDQSVQGLLAGAGGGRPEQAREYLAEQLRELTRAVAQFGFPRDLQKNRQLEELQAQIRDLAGQIERARGAVDLFHQSAGRLQELEAEYESARQDVSQRRKVLDALQEWRQLAERRRQQVRQVGSLRRALESARQVAERLDGAKARLSREWPELADLPPDTGDRLQELIGLQEDLTRRAEEARDLAARREASDRAAREAEDRLQAEFADVAGRPALPRDVRELQAKLADLERLEQQVADLAAQERGLAERLAQAPDWGALGRPAEDAVRRLRRAADEALQRWERYERLQRRAAERAAARERYSVFAGLPQEVRDLVRRFPVLEADLKRQAEVAAARTAELERHLRRLDAEAERLRQAYAVVAGLDEAVIAAAREKAALAREQDALKERRAAMEQRLAAERTRRAGIGAAAGLLLGFGLGYLAGSALGSPAALAVSGVLAVLGGLLGWLLGSRLGGGPAAEEARSLERQLEALAAKVAALNLGPLAGEPPHRLELLVQQWEEWRRRSAELEEERRELAESPETAAAREAYERARRDLDQLAERLRPFTERFTDPAAALAEWEQLEGELRRDRADLDELCRAEWGVPGDEVPDLDLARASGRWAELAALARLAAAAGLPPGEDGVGGSVQPPRRVADLVAWLRAATPAWWERVTAAAAEWSSLEGRLAEVRAERRRLTEPGADGPSPLDRLHQEVAALRARVAPFDEHADPAELEARLAEAEELRSLAERERSAARALQEQEQEVARQQAALERQAEELRQALAPALSATGGDPRAALERWRAREQVLRQAQEWEKELRGILTASGAADLAELEGKLVAAELEWSRATASLEELVRAHPGLPPVDEADNPLEVESRIESLKQEQARAEARLEQLDQQCRALRDQLRELGEDHINLAEAEMRLAELRREEQRLLRKIRALGIAYQELGEAVREYRSTYRERLEAAATDYFAGLTGRAGRRVRLSDEFAVSVVEPDGTVFTPSQLSKGAQDQLYLALRLAIGDLIAEEVRLPFVFDDPFLNCDEERLAHIRAALERLAGERQVLVLSHREEFAAWGARVVPA